MTKGFVLVVLVCAWAGMASGDYGPPKPSFIIKPAGPSKQHAWVGYGYSDYLPLSIPKPYFIPKWIPNMGQTYTAFWVPETPAPAGRNKAAAPAGPPVKGIAAPVKGFGPPKGNSVVAASGHSPAGDPIPSTAIRAPLPPQPQPPLFDSPVPKAPLPLATLPLVAPTQDPFATYAPAPLGQNSAVRASPPAPVAVNPPAPAAAPAAAAAAVGGSSFVPPKGEDVIFNSVVPASGAGEDSSSYTQF